MRSSTMTEAIGTPLASAQPDEWDDALPIAAHPLAGTARGGKLARKVRLALEVQARAGGRHPRASTSVRLVPRAGGGSRFVLDSELQAGRAEPAAAPPAASNAEVVRSLPRRQQARSATPGDARPFAPPPLAALTANVPRVTFWQSLRRLLVWVRAIGGFQLGTLWDVLRRLDSEERRAVRLRRMFEETGGTFIKIGQQMAIRLDLLPARYCEELSKMLDRVAPFPAQQAVAAVERITGRPLHETFSTFDPEPIGSASIACVYQAVLRESGEKVAVKVRRPGVCEVFAADFAVLDWLCLLAEALTLVRPGFTVNIRQEIRAALGNELDFRREARFQEIFERRARKAKRRFFGAPQVYHQYSGDDVLVQEFVAGIWLWEVLLGVEQGDAAALARMQELGVNPKLLAQRLMWVNNWGLYDNIAFHADPHPANIVVQAGNKLVFVDFGACGWLDSARKALYQRAFESGASGDLWAMVQVMMALSEPIPPGYDVTRIAKDMETAMYSQQLAFKSKHSPWYERTSAAVWLKTIEVLSKYQIPAPMDTLLYSRANLLYDTMAARLWPKVDYYEEYGRYAKDAQQKAAKRIKRSLRRRLESGPTDGDYQTLERVLRTADDGMHRLQRLFSVPYDFANLPYSIEKSVYAALMAVRFVMRGALVAGAATAVVWGAGQLTGQPVGLLAAAQAVVLNPWFQGVLALLGAFHLRLVLFRLGDVSQQR